jgi:hypothetical protein
MFGWGFVCVCVFWYFLVGFVVVCLFGLFLTAAVKMRREANRSMIDHKAILPYMSLFLSTAMTDDRRWD